VRTTIHTTILAILATGAGALAAAQDAPSVTVDIKPQDLRSALRELGEQAGLQILFRAEDVSKEELAPAVKGTMLGKDALEKLLKDSGLKFEFVNDKSVRVAPAATATIGGHESGDPSIRLAQAEQRSEVSALGAGSDGGAVVEEIVVTAQKRLERLIDVPISVVALSGDELQKRNIAGIDNLLTAVPGVSAQANGGFIRRIVMRGVSNFTGSSSLVGLYLDEAAVTSFPTAQLDLRTYDLERVEVLRGPQGTLYGEGSVGGTVRFITRNPNLQQLAMNANVQALATEGGDPGQRVEAMLNMPLVADQLGVRIAGTYEHQGGWIDQPTAGRSDFNGQNLSDVRIKGLWQPTEQFSANLMALVHRSNGSNNNGEDAAGNYAQVLGFTTRPEVYDDYTLYNLTLSYDFAAVRLLSASGYIQQQTDILDTGNALPVVSPTVLTLSYNPFQFKDNRIATQELRLTSTGSGPWNWTLGGFYRDARFDVSQTTLLASQPAGGPVPAPPFLNVSTTSRTQSKSWAAFGDVSRRLTDRFTLGAGLRYFEDEQELTNPALFEGTFDAVSPRVYGQYRLADNINTYASAGKGFRSGGFNLVQGAPPAFDPETTWTYELGAKMSVADGRLRLDAAVFYSDYTDYQIAGRLAPPAPPLSFTSNAGSAWIKGVEWGLAWRPLNRWELGFNGTWIDSEFYDVNTIPNPATGQPTSPYIEGDQLDNVPEYQFTVSAERAFSLNGRQGFARLDYNQQGRMSFRQRNLGPWFFAESDVLNLLSFNVGWQWNEVLSLGLLAQNLLNERGYMDPASISGAASRPRPRTYGIEFGIRFD
jgi:iron complex outermembrane recepter protein